MLCLGETDLWHEIILSFFKGVIFINRTLYLREERSEVITDGDRILIIGFKKVVKVLRVSLNALPATHSAAHLAEVWETRLLFEEKTFLLDLYGNYWAIFFNRKWFIYATKRAEFWIKIHKIHLIIFELESGLTSWNWDIRDWNVIIDSSTNRIYVLHAEINNMDGFRGTLYVRFKDHIGSVRRPI